MWFTSLKSDHWLCIHAQLPPTSLTYKETVIKKWCKSRVLHKRSSELMQCLINSVHFPSGRRSSDTAGTQWISTRLSHATHTGSRHALCEISYPHLPPPRSTHCNMHLKIGSKWAIALETLRPSRCSTGWESIIYLQSFFTTWELSFMQ